MLHEPTLIIYNTGIQRFVFCHKRQTYRAERNTVGGSKSAIRLRDIKCLAVRQKQANPGAFIARFQQIILPNDNPLFFLSLTKKLPFPLRPDTACKKPAHSLP